MKRSRRYQPPAKYYQPTKSDFEEIAKEILNTHPDPSNSVIYQAVLMKIQDFDDQKESARYDGLHPEV